DDGQLTTQGERLTPSDAVALRLEEALNSLYLALSRRQPAPSSAEALLQTQS
ncbi:TPA: NADPH-dependent FMN reductase, partial [Serratia rubidaea]|nr:NADPH-dependent FMN reductase [Serratia rubidaea]